MSNISRVGQPAVPADLHAADAHGAATAAAPIALQSAGLAGNAALAGVAAGTGSIEFGARGDAARAVQDGLRRLGHLAGPADGVFGRGTQSAVASFQRSVGLTPNGLVDQTTLAALDRKLAAAGPARPQAPVSLFAQGGQSSINQKMKGHRDSIDRTGVGMYYGDHGSFKGMKPAERQEWIRTHAKPGTTPPTPKEGSCIGWAMENVKGAYVAAGKTRRWAEIEGIVKRGGMRGTDLAKELQKDGWEGVYFNPDAKRSDDGNAEHSFTARQVAAGKPYYGIKVQHRVTNYRPTERSDGTPNTQKDLSGFEKLSKAPFFFGLARGGTHTFVGQQGRVNEFHWDRMPDDPDSIEERPLTEFPWNSGVVMVPPGTWPR